MAKIQWPDGEGYAQFVSDDDCALVLWLLRNECKWAGGCRGGGDCGVMRCAVCARG